MLSTDSILSEVLKSIFASGSKVLGSKAFDKLQKTLIASKDLRNYIKRVTNRVSYFVSYRPQPQHIDEAYVQPLILDSALSQTYIKPYTYEKFISSLSEGVSIGLIGESLTNFVSSRMPKSDELILQVKYIPIDQISTDYKSILVLGEAGAGKSALLSYLCLYRLRFKSPRLPVFADARDLESKKIYELLNDILKTLQLTDKDLKWLDNNLTFYIDGLDELSPKRFKEICFEIGILRKEFPGIEITVSCRSSAYHGELSFLTEISLVPFDMVRSENFIYRWFKLSSDSTYPENLVNILRKSERLKDLSTQPLLLALMCNAYRRYLNVSRRQTALFDQCIDSLLWQWDADRAVTRDSAFSSLDIEKKKWLHSGIAVALHTKRIRFSEKRFLIFILDETLPTYGISSSRAGELLSELCAHHGLLVKWTEDTYGFGHLALQEYLSAKWYADEKRWQSLLKKEFLTDSWWANTIALCFAVLSDASEAMNAIFKHEDLTELEKLRILANSLKFDPLVAINIRQSILQKILFLFHNGNATEHDEALDMLVGIEDEWCGGIIMKSLDGKLPTRELSKILKRSGGASKWA
jgi:hypothetical protein